MKLLVVVGPVVVFIATFTLCLWLISRRAGAAPRQMRRLQQRSQAIALVFAAVLFAVGMFQENWLLMGCATVMAVAGLIELRRRVRDSDTVANWVFEPGKCGQCGYDLTYVENPTTCPECGWVVPPDDAPAQRADWMMWWKCWRIDHLEHPRKKLCGMLAIALMFVTMVVWGVAYAGFAAAAIGALMAVHFSINTLRIARYLREQSAKRGVDS